MRFFYRYRHIILVTILSACVTVLVIVAFARYRAPVLTVAFLDVGQGEAIFIESPTGTQIMVDGGPGTAVLRRLGEQMSFFDRSIDALLITNPDQDHIAGFLEILKRYEVGLLIEPGVEKDTAIYKAIKREAEARNVPTLLARRGESIDLGGGAYLKILFPDRDIPGLEPNTGSIVAQLMYGETEILLMGDSVKAVEKYLVELDGAALASDVLKAGHHGSKTSTSDELLAAVHPAYAVISSGKGNSYGHPNQETLDALARFGVNVLRTDQAGTIVLVSDGKALSLKK